MRMPDQVPMSPARTGHRGLEEEIGRGQAGVRWGVRCIQTQGEHENRSEPQAGGGFPLLRSPRENVGSERLLRRIEGLKH